MIQDIIAIGTQAPSSGSPAAAAAAASVDFQNFLKLLTTQLRNQDPLSPLDSTQFVAQLASFSTVEQLVKANAQLDAIAAGLGAASIEKFAGWIGLEAEVKGAPAAHNGAPTPFRISANASATRVDVVVRDAAGREVSRGPAANTDDIQYWDGADAAFGAYFLSAEYFDGSKLIDTQPASAFSLLEQARLANGAVKLTLSSGVEIDPSQIIGLREPR
ncbi:MAG: hypothetical protein HXY21_14010 [Parvularculaceae bacterium]|nr:hypothetical protein [Parvularculaceae bacterium]